MDVRTAYDPTAGEVLTATNLEKLAGGWIGYAEVTADQSGITVEVDLTSLTVAVTVGPSRRIKITASVRVVTTVNNDAVTLKIAEGATILQQRDVTLSVASNSGGLVAEVVLTPTTGAHTYKLRMVRTLGSVTMQAGATYPAFICVEDIGPAA